MTDGTATAVPPTSTRGVVRNATWLVVERVVGMAAAAAVAVVLARALGPGPFGAYSAALSLVLILSDFAGFGFGLIVNHEILSRPVGERPVIVGTSVRLRAGTAVLLIVPCAALVHTLFLQDHGGWTTALLLSLLPLVRAFEVYEFFQHALERGRALAMARLATSAIAAVALGLFLLAGGDELPGAAGVDLARYVPYLVILGVLVRRAVGRGSYATAEARHLLRRAVPYTLPIVAFAVNMRIGQVLLGLMADDHEVGIYAAGARLSEATYFLPIVLMTAFLPRLVEARRTDARRYDELLVRSYSVMWGGGLASCAVTALAAVWVIPLLFGDEFRDSIGVLQVMSLALPFVFIRGVISRWFVLEDRISLAVVTTGSSAVVNVVANLALIPSFGAMGSAVATVLAYAVSGYLILYFVPSTRVVAGQMNRGLLGLPAVAWHYGRHLLTPSGRSDRPS